MEGELCGPAQDRCGLPGILHPRQLHDDPAFTGLGDGRFGNAERVDTSAEHLQGPLGGPPVRLHGGGVAGLEHDLSAATQVEA
jgi:hypothetical protein